MGKIKGVLFDSGDTLVRPRAGSWWPRQTFIDAFMAHGIEDADMSRFDEAISLGIRNLDDNHSLTTEEEERRQFRTAHAIILEALGVRSPTANLISELFRLHEEAVDLVLFADTRRALDYLSGRGIKLGIVSDNWPSLERTVSATWNSALLRCVRDLCTVGVLEALRTHVYNRH